MPLSKKRDKERKRLARLEKLISVPQTSNAVQPKQWYTCELTEDVGCGKSLGDRGANGCVECLIYQRVKPKVDALLSTTRPLKEGSNGKLPVKPKDGGQDWSYELSIDWRFTVDADGEVIPEM